MDATDRAWIRNALSEAAEHRDGVFRCHARNDAIVGVALVGTLLGGVITTAFTAVTVFLAIRAGAVAALTAVPAAAAAVLLSIFGRELFTRLRRMGAFVIDPGRRSLARPTGAALGTIRVVRPSTRFAAAAPQTGLSWWIVAELEGGASFRVARGAWAEVRPLLLRLRDLGVPVDGIAEAVLLRSAGASIKRLGEHRFEFECPERLAKIVAPGIVVFWIGFASMLLAAPIMTHAPRQTWLYMSPLLIFFVVGIVIGILNTLHFYRRSGTFVVDTATGSLHRNGIAIAGPSDGSRFVTGNPSQRGVSSARSGLGSVVGPQVLALQLAGGRTFHLLRGMSGDVRYGAELLRAEGVTVVDL